MNLFNPQMGSCMIRTVYGNVFEVFPHTISFPAFQLSVQGNALENQKYISSNISIYFLLPFQT